MNQKDYKKIAEILEEETLNYDIRKSALKRIANNLADYFEEEDFRLFKLGEAHIFNKQQFLKDCGVGE